MYFINIYTLFIYEGHVFDFGCVWVFGCVCGFVGSLCKVSYALLHLLILGKCYGVHINASSL